MTFEGTYSFLVKDVASDSNRVVRVNVMNIPSSWGLFLIQKGTNIVLLNPMFKYSMEFEQFFEILDAKSCIMFLEESESAILKI